MRVALVVDRFDPFGGGLERWTAQFAAHLLDRGHEVDIVTFAAANNTLAVRIHTLEIHASALERGRRIEACVAALGASVVHDTGSGWSGDVFHPQTGSHLTSMDREIASHDLYRRIKAGISPRTNLRRWRMARLEARQVRTARHLVAVSRRIRRDLVTRHGVPDSRITVIPNGVDTARFAPDRAGVGRDEVRRRLGIADGLLLLGAAHNLRLKGMDNAIRALSLLRASAMKPEPHLAIAGGAPDPFWRALATRLGVADRVHFLGQVDDMVPLYGAADVYVHPTRWDACSLSTIEAGAAGLPVITTAMNGAAELIEDGRTGFVLRDPEDVGTLADHLRRLSDPVLRRQIGDAALAASSGHDIRDNLRAVEAVLVRMARQEP